MYQWGCGCFLINPFTNELLHFPITPGQTANVPQGWWHYEVATADHTHLLAIFDAPVPEAIFGSDILRLTPANVLAHTYCLDERKVQEALAPLQGTVIIGPPKDCKTQVAPASNHICLMWGQISNLISNLICSLTWSRLPTEHPAQYASLCKSSSTLGYLGRSTHHSRTRVPILYRTVSPHHIQRRSIQNALLFCS